MATVGRFAAVISLQGIEDVYAKLKGLGPAGEQAMRSLDSAVQNVKLDGLGQSVTRASGAVGEFRDSLHILHPILRVAGIEMGNFSAFSRAAGAGVVGLGVALTGAVAIGLLKLSSNLGDAKVQLQGLLKNKDVADQVFGKLEEVAKKSGVPLEGLISTFRGLVNAQEDLAAKSGKAKIVSITTNDIGIVTSYATALSLSALKSNENTKAINALNVAFQNYRVPQDKATQAINQFFQTAAKNGGKITGDMIRALHDVSEGAADAIAGLAGQGGALRWAAELDKANAEFGRFVDNIARNADKLKAATPSISQQFDRMWESIKRSITPEPGSDIEKGIVALVQQAIDELNNTEFPSFNWDRILASPAGQALQSITNLFEGFSWDGLFGGLSDAWGRALQGLQDDWDRVVQTLKSIWQGFLSWFTGPNINAPPSQGGGGGHAAGGLIRGPGTSTSDSILARLSTGEFVVRAKAVQWYGADLLRAINSMRLPRDFMRGFNMGGLVDDMVRSLVPGALPRFAAGGMATANMRPVILNINGQQFGGLQGTQDAVSQLERYAVISNLRATGRSPGWNK